jgi:rare lipoprotein A
MIKKIWMTLAALLVAAFLLPTIAKAEVASYYYEGKRTANGERFNPEGMTAAHRTLPFGTMVRVCRDSCVIVRINDRGPFIRGRDIDLSRGAARAIGLIGVGVGKVSMQRI